MRISDWSSDVCSSDLRIAVGHAGSGTQVLAMALLSANGIAEGGKTTFLELEGEAASAALLAHQADAVILSGDSASVTIFRDLVHADGIRLFDFTQGAASESRFRYLNSFELPAGVFDCGEKARKSVW